MKKLLLLAFILTAAYAEPFEWPTEMAPVRLNNKAISVSWKDGKPFAQRSEVFMFLGLPREGDPDVELAPLLAELKANITTKPDGTIDVIVPKTVTGTKRVSNQAARFKRELEMDRRAKAMAPKLVVVSSQCFTADTEHIRANVVVGNSGGSPTEACTAYGTFTDWFGKSWAKPCAMPVPILQPGETVELTFFSLVHKNDEAQKADKYQCKVTFSK